MPKLTIVVPVYGVAPYLAQCVDSILAQTFADFTLLLLDDGSPDGAPAICDQYAAQDARVTVVHQQNMGVEQTVLKGIRMATTPYIGFVDGDDWLLPQMYQALLEAIETEGADLVQCGALINGNHGEPAFSSETQAVITTARETLYRPFFETTASLAPLTNARWSKVYRTELLQAAIENLPQGVSIGEDLLMNLAYLCHCEKALVLAESNFYCYRNNADSLTQKYSDKKQDSLLRLYPMLSEIAKQNNFTDEAVRTEGKNAIGSLMLDALLSHLSIAEKATCIRFLHGKLEDKPHLLRYAKERPLIGKVALYFVHLRLYYPISAMVTLFLKLTARRSA